MLPSPNRMTRAADFGAVVRSGRRARCGTVVVHHRRSAQSADAVAPVVGFIVSKGVGISVVRHRVTRRLRAQVRPLLPLLPPGSTTVVRALPAAAVATSDQLAADLGTALERLAAR